MRPRKPARHPLRDEESIGGGFIHRLLVDSSRVPSRRSFPWNLPALRDLDALDLHPAVTFFVGENGSGKSTLLEGLAQAAGFDREGGSRNFNLTERSSWSDAGSALKLQRGVRREKDTYYLRAESFFNVASRIDELGIPLRNYGGRSLHEQSHGESFLALATNRFAGEGLYLLDEPEAALSPARQLAFLKILHAHASGSQFVIATHSPILMAYPNATIYEFNDRGIQPVGYEETDHFRLTRDFLNSRDVFLRELFREEE